MRLVESHGLRAYDAVQLAAAQEINASWTPTGLGVA
jgi:predicted nucleic acid-binding protein